MNGMKRMKTLTALLTGALLLAGVAPAAAQERKRERPDGVVKVAGKVIAVAEGSFDVRTPRRGEIKVQYTTETEWMKGAAATVKVGMFVAAAGKLTGNVLQAEKIGVGVGKRARANRKRGPQRFRKMLLRAEITAVEGDTLTVKTKGGRELRIEITDETRFRGGTASDLEKGVRIGVAANRTKTRRPEGSERPRTIEARLILFPKKKAQD